MNVIDILILLWLISAVIRGYFSGFLRQAFSFAGFLGGLIIGSWIATALADDMQGGSRLLLTLITTFGLALVLAVVGEVVAAKLQSKLHFKIAHNINAALGVVLGAVAVLLGSWLIASAMTRLPLANLGLYISESKIISAVDRVMPPAPTVINRLGRLISPHGFPQVYVGNEPIVDPAGPPATEDVQAAADKAVASMVRVESQVCGGIATGSGFIAKPGFIVTNAHVIAGARQPIVLHESNRYRAETVWFDPAKDFAVLRVNELQEPGLRLSTELAERSQSGAVLGYPGGGGLIIDPAVVLGVRDALGRDIYDRNLTLRQIYELQSDIEQGNSGGPFVLPDGSVAGLIFGESVTNNGVSYAITSLSIAEDLQTATTRNKTVSTGPCM